MANNQNRPAGNFIYIYITSNYMFYMLYSL